MILLININTTNVNGQYHFDVSNHDDVINNNINNNLYYNYLIVTPDNDGIKQWAVPSMMVRS